MVRPLALAILILASGCEDDTFALLVDVRTDYVPGFEVASADVRLATPGGGADALESRDLVGSDPIAGVRVAEFSGLAAGEYLATVTLRRSDDAQLAERVVRVQLRGDTGVTVVITRSCEGVVCPASGDDPGATQCVGGRCVQEDCTPETPETCPPAECPAVACSSGAACSRPVCEDGICLLVAEDGDCAAGQWCDPVMGCRERGTEVDAGLDAGIDAGVDAALGDPLAALDDEFDTMLRPEWMSVPVAGAGTTMIAGGRLTITATGPEGWFDADLGPLLFQSITGDFLVETTVIVESASMPGNPPAVQFRLAGILARDPTADTGAVENHIKSSIGSTDAQLQGEAKTTVDSVTVNDFFDIGVSEAVVRICRVDQTFRTLIRPMGSATFVEREFDRSGSPMPDELQVGIFVESWRNATPDVVGHFDYVRFRTPTSLADCSASL